MMFPKTSLILGGARSGKSAYAEKIAQISGLEKIYLATSQALDDEMSARISRHRDQRAGAGWRTIEEPVELGRALRGAGAGEVVLIDCATLWLTNHLLASADLEAEITGLVGAFESCAATVIVVSNELGQGNVAADAMTRRFNDAHGIMNQSIAAKADYVAMVVAGLPMVLKGSAPA